MEKDFSKDSRMVLVLVFVLLFSFGILNFINKGSFSQAQVGNDPYCACSCTKGCCPDACEHAECCSKDGCPERCTCASETECAIAPIYCKGKEPMKVPILCCPRINNECPTYDPDTDKCTFPTGLEYDPEPCQTNPNCFGRLGKKCTK